MAGSSMGSARGWNTWVVALCALVTLALGCMGCGEAVEPEPVAEAAPATAALEAAPPCEVVFSPAADIAELVESAAQQWSEATGCDVHTGPGGIPVSFLDRIQDDQGNPQCGVTHRLRDDSGAILGASDIEISANLGDRCRLHARDVLHEMGHGLAPHQGHTGEGLMARVPNGIDVVDDVSRAFVCQELGC